MMFKGNWKEIEIEKRIGMIILDAGPHMDHRLRKSNDPPLMIELQGAGTPFLTVIRVNVI